MRHQASLSLPTFLLFSVPYGMVIARKAKPHDWQKEAHRILHYSKKIDRTLNNCPITFPAAASLRFHFHFALTFISPAGSFITVFWGSTGAVGGWGEKLFSSVDSVKRKLFRVRSANAATTRAFAASNSIPFDRACWRMHMGAPFILNFSDFLAMNFNHFRENFRLTFLWYHSLRLDVPFKWRLWQLCSFQALLLWATRLHFALMPHPKSPKASSGTIYAYTFPRLCFALPCRETIIYPCC